MWAAVRSLTHTITHAGHKTESGSSKASKIQKSRSSKTADHHPSSKPSQAANTDIHPSSKKLSALEDQLLASAFEAKEKGQYLRLCDLQEQRGQLYEKHENMPERLTTLCLSCAVERYESAYRTYEGHKAWLPDDTVAERCAFLSEKIDNLKEQILNRKNTTIYQSELADSSPENLRKLYNEAMSRGTLKDRVNVCRAMGLNQEADKWQAEYDVKFSEHQAKAVPSPAASLVKPSQKTVDPAEAAYQAALEFFLGSASH